MKSLWALAVMSAMALPVAAQEPDSKDALRAEIERVSAQLGEMNLLDLIEGGTWEEGESSVVYSVLGECPELPPGAALLEQVIQLPATFELNEGTLLDLIEGENPCVEFSFHVEESSEQD